MFPQLTGWLFAAEVAPGKALTICYLTDPARLSIGDWWETSLILIGIAMSVILCVHFYSKLRQRSHIAQATRPDSLRHAATRTRARNTTNSP